MSDQSKASEPRVAASDATVAIQRDATPTIFADGLLGGSVEAGVVRLELLARHLDAKTASLTPALVGRLMLPAENFSKFVAALVDLANRANGAPRSTS